VYFFCDANIGRDNAETIQRGWKWRFGWHFYCKSEESVEGGASAVARKDEFNLERELRKTFIVSNMLLSCIHHFVFAPASWAGGLEGGFADVPCGHFSTFL